MQPCGLEESRRFEARMMMDDVIVKGDGNGGCMQMVAWLSRRKHVGIEGRVYYDGTRLVAVFYSFHRRQADEQSNSLRDIITQLILTIGFLQRPTYSLEQA
jgi:hypothetical protein